MMQLMQVFRTSQMGRMMTQPVSPILIWCQRRNAVDVVKEEQKIKINARFVTRCLVFVNVNAPATKIM
jgi:acyl-ACP thioesterase